MKRDNQVDVLEMARQAGELLRVSGLTLAVAESCTGGLLGDAITDVAGSSDYFLGGIISYSDRIKRDLLGVREETLVAFGAVSAQCAQEMARGARRALNADLALSVTGIAGPGGGTPDKPVGLTYLHLSAPGGEHGRREVWPGDRQANKRHSAAAALHLLLTYLEERRGVMHEQYIDEPVLVQTRGSRAQDGVRPTTFMWQGRTWQIQGLGRRWVEDDQGIEWRCFLAETAEGDIVELRWQESGNQWRLRRAWWRELVV